MRRPQSREEGEETAQRRYSRSDRRRAGPAAEAPLMLGLPPGEEQLDVQGADSDDVGLEPGEKRPRCVHVLDARERSAALTRERRVVCREQFDGGVSRAVNQYVYIIVLLCTAGTP